MVPPKYLLAFLTNSSSPPNCSAYLILVARLVHDAPVHDGIEPVPMRVVGSDALVLHRARGSNSRGARAWSEVDDVGHAVVLHDAMPEGNGLHLVVRERMSLVVDVLLQARRLVGKRDASRGTQDARLGLVAQWWSKMFCQKCEGFTRGTPQKDTPHTPGRGGKERSRPYASPRGTGGTCR